jgi:hypothetical protein
MEFCILWNFTLFVEIALDGIGFCAIVGEQQKILWMFFVHSGGNLL